MYNRFILKKMKAFNLSDIALTKYLFLQVKVE